MWSAIYVIVFNAALFVIFLIFYLFGWNDANIPCTLVINKMWHKSDEDEHLMSPSTNPTEVTGQDEPVEMDLEYPVSFTIYVLGWMSFLGECLLTLFGGIGLFSLPMDYVNQYLERPKARSTADVKTTKKMLE